MPLEPFEGPLLKLRRGRQHIEELRLLTQAYTARMPIYRTSRGDPGDGAYVDYEIVMREAPPIEVALILGDAIHNLRVSLDLLANDLVRLAGGDTEGVYFPYAKCASELKRQIKRRNFDRAAPEVVNLLHKLAPYKGGNEMLRGLHDLDIQDKHQMLIPAIGHVRFPGGGVGIPALEAKTGTLIKMKLFWPAYGDEAAVLGEQLPVVFDLIFPFVGPFVGRSVAPTLSELAQYIFCVFQSFATLYGRILAE